MTDESSSRRYLSLWFPFLSADRWQLSCKPDQPPLDPSRPRAFIEKIKGASRLVKVDARAIAIGLRPGMTLVDARARVPALRAIAFDHAADRAFLTQLADMCLSFTPSVAYENPDGLVLDITGCAHLFGDESELVKRLQKTLIATGVSVARISIAPTPDMARALARFGRGQPIIARDDRHVRALPVSALECHPEDALVLKRAGLRTIGDIADRPSVLFSARLTQDFSVLLSRILGEEDRRIAPLRPLPSYLFDHRCPEPVVSAEVISRILEELARRAAGHLQEHGEGGRQFETTFFRTDGCVRRIRVETSHRTRDPAVVLRLFRDRLDALADPLDPGFGFDVIRFHVLRTEPHAASQTTHEARDEHQELFAALLDRLGAMFGKKRVLRVLPVDTHIPEQAQIMAPATDGRSAAFWEIPVPDEPPSRPLHLFDTPHPIEMQNSTADGTLLRFRWRRVLHEIATAEGPERICDPWWRPTLSYGSRDYYRIETQQGRRFWVFCSNATASSAKASWFLHGVFP